MVISISSPLGRLFAFIPKICFSCLRWSFQFYVGQPPDQNQISGQFQCQGQVREANFFLFSISGGPSRWWGFHEVSTRTAGWRAEGGQCSQVSTCHLHQLPASQAFYWIHYLLLTALTFHLVHREGLIILIEKMIMCMHTYVTERALDYARVWN